MIIVRIVQFVKIVQLVQLNYYGYIKFFGGFVGTWVGAFTFDNIIFDFCLMWLIELKRKQMLIYIIFSAKLDVCRLWNKSNQSII